MAAGERVKRLKTETTELVALFGDTSLLERFIIFATRSHSLTDVEKLMKSWFVVMLASLLCTCM